MPKRVLGADKEAEAVERALDLIIPNHERNRLATEVPARDQRKQKSLTNNHNGMIGCQ
jgi:hypothetical protein